jgi:hypothetical protein
LGGIAAQQRIGHLNIISVEEKKHIIKNNKNNRNSPDSVTSTDPNKTGNTHSIATAPNNLPAIATSNVVVVVVVGTIIVAVDVLNGVVGIGNTS